jgi:prephenate dehydrogenase
MKRDPLARSSKPWEKPLPTLEIAVVGLGLMGGSLARSLKDKATVVGFDPDDQVTRKAAELGIRVSHHLEDALAQADIVFCAAPLSDIASCLEEICHSLDRNEVVVDLQADAAQGERQVILSDLGSVKMPFLKTQLGFIPDKVALVPGHPMAGNEKGGIEHSTTDLFKGTSWALCLDEGDLTSWATVARVVLATGAAVIPCTAAEHDAAVALTSHLPHVIASSLESLLHHNTQLEGLCSVLEGGSWQGATRVASSPKETVLAMCWENRHHLSSWLGSLITELTEVEGLLQKKGGQGFEDWLSSAMHWSRSRQGVAKQQETTPLVLSGPAREDSRRWLLELGRRGGRVVALGPTCEKEGELVLLVTSEQDPLP